MRHLPSQETEQTKAASPAPKKRLSPWAVAGICVAGVVVLFLLCAGIYFLTLPGRTESLFDGSKGPASQDGELALPPAEVDYLAQADTDFMKNRVNILLMGVDFSTKRGESEREDFRTDTMMLVSLDFDSGEMDMITIPRDTYATVPKATGSLYKINSAAYFGGGMCHEGFMNACDAVSILLGVPVPYYAAVDMNGLEAVVDAMGGVDYTVEQEMTYGSITLQPGPQHLNGKQVLTYCRCRKGIGTDIDRQKRQQNMLLAILDQLKSTNQLKNFPKIYKSVEDMIYTNLTFEQICALVLAFMELDPAEDVHKYTLEGEYHWAKNVYFYLIDQQKKCDLVEEVFGVRTQPDLVHDLHAVMAEEALRNPDDLPPQEGEAAPEEPGPGEDPGTLPPEGDTTPDGPAQPDAPDAPDAPDEGEPPAEADPPAPPQEPAAVTRTDAEEE